MKKLLAIGVILLFIGMTISSTGYNLEQQSTIVTIDGNTLYVGGSGPGNYTTIQAAIDDSSNGDTVYVYDDSSPYYENLEVDKSISLLGEDRDTTKIRNDGEDNHVVNISVDLVNISGFTIRGCGYPYYGIGISSNYNNIAGNIMSNNYNGIYLKSSSNNTITGNIITSNDGYGIELVDSSSNNTIMGNTISNNGEDGIYLESSSNNTITGNIITSNGWYCIELDYSSSNTITGNNISNNEGEGIHLESSSNNTINNNNFSGNWKCIGLSYSSNNVIKDNNLLYNTHGIDLDSYCINNIITGNTIQNIYCCTGIGVRISSNGNLILNNTITSAPGGDGVIIFKSKYNTVIGNTISNCYDGIFLWSSSYNTISCNNIMFSYSYGIWSGTLPIKDYGINLRHSRRDNINSNNIPTNSYGMHHFDSCNDNTIHHNNFFNNTQNAYDECSNIWDNGYPSGGNFWDDYNGTDDDGDGIGDTPYNISGGDNQDRYPLMEPWGDNLFPIAKFTWTPSLPDPVETILFNASESIDYDGNITLYEWDWDNDGEYDENHTNSTATHSWSNYGYYPVTLRVTDNDNLTNSKTKTVRVGNYPPYEPSNPNPEDGAKYVPVDTILNWTGGDPDPGDIVTYDVYFGVTNPPTKKSSNQTGNSYDPVGDMELFKKYYWYIVSWDSQGLSTSGQIWHFTTDPPPLPEVEIVNPREGYFHFSGIPLFQTVLNLLADTVSFGGFRLRSILINATDEVDNSEDLIVKVYLNGEEQGNASYRCDWKLHEWFWTGRALGTYQLKVTAENAFGLKRSAEMKVWNFCSIP